MRSTTPACVGWIRIGWTTSTRPGLRHTHAKKNATDRADSLDHIPMRHLLAFTAVVITTSRDVLADKGHTTAEIERMHAAFTESVMLHVTVWSRACVPAEDW